ncbi:MAG: hypothetical protein ACJATT_004823, partial [Myxococcota bacterium]
RCVGLYFHPRRVGISDGVVDGPQDDAVVAVVYVY